VRAGRCGICGRSHSGRSPFSGERGAVRRARQAPGSSAGASVNPGAS
jgi:hypothetical protein